MTLMKVGMRTLRVMNQMICLISLMICHRMKQMRCQYKRKTDVGFAMDPVKPAQVTVARGLKGGITTKITIKISKRYGSSKMQLK